LRFRLYPLRFSFLARETVRFPPVMAANTLRGGFGATLRRTASAPDYARMFEPAATSAGPSGLADWPRPFVFRARHLDGRAFEPGERFSFDVNLFEMRNPAIDSLAQAFAQLAGEGLGPGRGRAELTGVSLLAGDLSAPMELSLDPAPGRVERVTVEFVTPMELKSGRGLVERPEFGALAARIRDRLSTLRELYDDGPLAIDFRGFGERAARVRMTLCRISAVVATRRSSHTGQTHSIGGFIGVAEYEGDLSEFIPYLRAARWTGVGRQTVWGKGEIFYTIT
jgi:CRISPR-associated endoribonuclease Cas6